MLATFTVRERPLSTRRLTPASVTMTELVSRFRGLDAGESRDPRRAMMLPSEVPECPERLSCGGS